MALDALDGDSGDGAVTVSASPSNRDQAQVLMWYLAGWMVIIAVLLTYGRRIGPDMPLVMKAGPYLIYDGELSAHPDTRYHAFIIPRRYGRGFVLDQQPPWAVVRLQVTATAAEMDVANIAFGEGAWAVGFTCEPGDEGATAIAERVLCYLDETRNLNQLILPVRVSGRVNLRLEVLD